MVVHCLTFVFCGEVLIPLTLMQDQDFVLLGGKNGREALVGLSGTDRAHSNSAATNIVLLSAIWAVRAVFANWNTPALGKILDQHWSVTQPLFNVYLRFFHRRNPGNS